MVKKLFTASLFALALAGCGGNSSNAGTAYMVGVNAIPSVGNVSVIANGTAVLNSGGFGTDSSAYVAISSGNNALVYLTSSANTQLASVTTNLLSKGYYITYALGSANLQTLIVVPQTVAPPTVAGNGRLIFANASTIKPSVDVYVTAVGASLTGLTPQVTSLTEWTSGAFAEVPAGTYEVRYTVSGTQTVVLDVPSIAVGSTGTTEIQSVGIMDVQAGVTQQALPTVSDPVQLAAAQFALPIHSAVSGR